MSPDPLAVNMAVWEIRKALAAIDNCYVLVHCTHGFNRSGETGPAVRQSARRCGGGACRRLAPLPLHQSLVLLAIAAASADASSARCHAVAAAHVRAVHAPVSASFHAV